MIVSLKHDRFMLFYAFVWLSCCSMLFARASASASASYLLLVGTVDGNLHAVDSSLRHIWSRNLGGSRLQSIVSAPENGNKYQHVIPALDGTIIFDGQGGLSRQSLRHRLSRSYPTIGRDGLIHTVNSENSLYLVNLEDGTVIADDDFSLLGVDQHVSKMIPPLWMARTDHDLQGKDKNTGMANYFVRFSELYALDDEDVETRYISDGKSKASGFLDSAEILCSPDGQVHIIHQDGSKINRKPIFLNSPAMNAFVVAISDRKSKVVARLNVRYGLGESSQLSKPPSSFRSQNANQNLLLVQSSLDLAGREILYGLTVDNFYRDGDDFPAQKQLPHVTKHSGPLTEIRSALKTPWHSKYSTRGMSNSPSDSVSLSHHDDFEQRSIMGLHWVDSIPQESVRALEDTQESPSDRELNTTRKKMRRRPEWWTLIMLLGISFLLFSGTSLSSKLFAWMTTILMKISNNTQIHDVNSEKTDSAVKIGSMEVSTKLLGKGSNGTLVFEGKLDGRPVAVKRMLSQYSRVAAREVRLLIKSDGHPNVVRYFLAESRSDFVYLGLQLCDCSLRDLIGELKCNISRQPTTREVVTDGVRQMLRQIAEGLAFLHEQNIVHRDLKPHNILCNRTPSTKRFIQSLSDLSDIECKISDMGVSKHLDGDRSFSTSLPCDGAQKIVVPGAHEPVGTIGWQAPEMIIATNEDRNFIGKKTLAVDIFSLGCVIGYVLGAGIHPFGEWFEREHRIINNLPSFDAINHIADGELLLQKMLCFNPTDRLTAREVCDHPFFWLSSARIDFVSKLSDRIETDREIGKGQLGQQLEYYSRQVFVDRWDDKILVGLLSESGRFRKYDPFSFCDLIRLIRNKKNHFLELPSDLLHVFSNVQGMWEYFDKTFPRLFISCILAENSNAELATPKEFPAESPSQQEICGVVWQKSPAQKQHRCRGWWKSSSEWLEGSTRSSSKPQHQVKSMSNPRYRSRFCAHWDNSHGESCPLKKGKCDFAHGCIELRATDRTIGILINAADIEFKDAINFARNNNVVR